MLQLLQRYSLSDILIFIVILCIAIKGLLSFFDLIGTKTRKIFTKQYQKISQREQVHKNLKENAEILERLRIRQDNLQAVLNKIKDKINIMMQSDRDAIKAYITEKHYHFCEKKKWIDNFNLDVLERRYSHYKEEGGNSFIDKFMEDLRNLPQQPPKEQ